MDSLDSTSFDAGSSAAALGSDSGSSSDATSPDAQASWGQAMADAGVGRDTSADDTGWDAIGSPWDTGATTAASALGQDSTSSQSAEQPAQGNASGALPAAALASTVGAATMDEAAAGGSGLLAELGLGGLARTAAGLLGSGLAAPVAGALALFWPSSTASNDTAPSGGWPAQPPTGSVDPTQTGPQVMHSEGTGPTADSKEAGDGPPAQSPTGWQGSPIEIEPGTNKPTVIDGWPYSGHAIDRMQGRGIPSSVVDDAIKNGVSTPGKTPGTTRYKGENGTVVIVGGNGKVITVY